MEWKKHLQRTIKEPRYLKWVLQDKLKERRFRQELRRLYFAHLAGADAAPLPHSLNLFLTETCNLSCGFCEYAHRTPARSLDFLQTAHILRQAAELGVREVNFTGGEPLTHPDYFRIQQITRELGMRVLLSTNGILLKKYAEQFRGWERNIYVSVSVDGACAETHNRLRGVERAFERTIEGIQALTRVLDPDMIELTFLITSKNVGELVQAYNLSRQLGIWFSMNPVQGSPEFYLNGESVRLYYGQLKMLKKIAYKVKSNWQYYQHVPDYHRAEKLHVRCAGLGLSFGVDVLGNLKPCCVWNHPYSAGNLLTTPLTKLWHSQESRQIRQALYEGNCVASCYNITYLKDFTRITGQPFLIGGWNT